jgi:hypothetical protein
MWAPPVGDHMREREGSGRWRAGSRELGRGGRKGEKRGRGLGRSFLFFKLLFFKLSKVLNSFKTFSSFKLFYKNFKSV